MLPEDVRIGQVLHWNNKFVYVGMIVGIPLGIVGRINFILRENRKPDMINILGAHGATFDFQSIIEARGDPNTVHVFVGTREIVYSHYHHAFIPTGYCPWFLNMKPLRDAEPYKLLPMKEPVDLCIAYNRVAILPTIPNRQPRIRG